MRSRTYKDEGIVLKRFNLGEADRLLTIFCKYRGKIQCLAKGVRKPTSRKSASIELFSCTKLFIAKGRDLDIVTQAEVIEEFAGIRSQLKAVKAAYHLVELTDLLTAQNQENAATYQALRAALTSISKKGYASREEIIKFEKEILLNLGFGFPSEANQKALEKFIESIIEKRLQSVRIFKEI